MINAFINPKKLIQRLLVLSLSINFLFGALNLYAADSGENEWENLMSIEATANGRTKFLELIIDTLRPKLVKELKGHSLGDKFLGATDTSKCTKKKLKDMTINEAYYKCPGIPDYFFVDGAGFPWYNFFPRPVQLKVQNPRVVDLALGKSKVSCKNDECVVKIPLDKLSLQSRLTLINVNSSKKTKKGEVLLDFDEFKFETKEDEKKPYLVITFNFNDHLTHDSPLEFNLKKSYIRIPTGSIQIKLPNHEENLKLSELINSQGKLAFGPTRFGIFLGVVTKLSDIPNLKSYYHFIDLNESLSNHLNNKDKIKDLNKILNDLVLDLILAQINEFIGSYTLFAQTQIKIPSIAMRNLIDYTFWHQFHCQFEDFLSKYKKLLKLKQVPSESLSHFEFLNLNVDFIFKFLNLMQGKEIEMYIHSWINKIQKIHEVAVKNELSLDGDEISLEEWPKKLKYAQKMMRLIGKNNFDAMKLKLRIFNEKNKMQDRSIYHYVLFTDNENSEERTSRVDLNQRPIETITSEFDLQINVDTKGINALFYKLYLQNKFDFCVNTGSLYTCDMLETESLNQVLIFKLVTSPKIQWDANRNQLYFDINYQLKGEQQIKNTKIYYCPDNDKPFEFIGEELYGNTKQVYELISKRINYYFEINYPLLKRILLEENEQLENSQFFQKVNIGIEENLVKVQLGF